MATKQLKNINVSNFRDRISVETDEAVADAQGGFTSGWVEHLSSWAQVKPLTSRQQAFADKLENRVTHEVTLRYRSTIQTCHRINWDGRILQIHGVVNVEERDVFMILSCEEGAAS